MHGQLCRMEQPERDCLKSSRRHSVLACLLWEGELGTFALGTQHNAWCSGRTATCLVRAGPEWLCPQNMHTSQVIAHALWAASGVTGVLGVKRVEMD